MLDVPDPLAVGNDAGVSRPGELALGTALNAAAIELDVEGKVGHRPVTLASRARQRGRLLKSCAAWHGLSLPGTAAQLEPHRRRSDSRVFTRTLSER